MRGNRKSLVALSAAVAGTLLASQSAHAVNYVWNALSAGNASGSWSTTTNWTPNLPGGVSQPADTLNLSTLDITQASTLTLDSPESAAVLTFGNTDPTVLAPWIVNASTSAANNATNVLSLTTTDNPTMNILGAGQVATINATISDGSVTTWGLAKGGAGTLVLTANNSAMTGTVFINNGTLLLNFNNTWSPATNIIGDTSSGSTAAAHLEMQGGTLNLTGNPLTAGGNSQTFSGNTNMGIGAAEITFTQNGASSLSLNLGALSHSATAGGTLDINLPTTGTVSATSATSTGGLIVDGTGSAYVTVNNGADWAAINGANVVAGSSVAGFYTSSVSGLAGNADILSNPTLSTGTTVTSIRQNDTSAHTIDLGGTNTLTTGGILMTPTAGGGLTIQNGTLTASGTNDATVLVNQNNTNFPVTISAAIANNAGGTTELIKNGAGTLVLSGNNTYNGNTYVNGGTLSVTGGVIGPAADASPFPAIEIAPAFGNTAVMNISGTGTIINDDRFLIAGNTGNFSGGTGTLNMTGGTVNSGAWFSVGLEGNGTFNQSGGTVNVIGGFAQFEVAVFGTGSATINLSGTAAVNLENGSRMGFGTAGTSGNGTVNQNGGSVTFYSNAGTTIGGGSVILGETGSSGTYTYNLNGGTLTVPNITHTAGTGIFNFNGGTLVAATNGAIMTTLSSANVQAGGAIINTNGLTVALPQPLLHAAALGATPDGGLTKIGAGTLQLTGVSTYTGHTVISQGLVQLPATSSPIPVPIGAYSFDNVNDNANGNGTGNPVTSGTLNSGDVVVNSGSGGTALNGVVNTADYVTVGSGASLTTGKFGNGLSLDGGGTSVDIPSQITATSGSANYTVSAWVETSTPGGAILSKNNGADTFNAGNSTLYLGTNPPPGAVGANSNFPVGVQNSGGFQGSGTPVVDGTFHLVTFVGNAGAHSIYVDGQLTTATATGMSTGDNSTITRLGFNADIFGAGDGNIDYAGVLDQVDFFNVALSQQQIQELVTSNSVTTGTSASSTQVLPSTTDVSITASGAGLDLNGNNQTIGSLSGVAGSTVAFGTGTLTTGGDNVSTTFAGNLSGIGGLTKSGTGSTFALTGTNIYAGNTNVSAGALVIGSTTALPSGTNLSIGANSLAAVNRGSGSRILLQLNSLSIAGTGTLDMANNDMIVHNSNAGTVTTMTGQLQQAWNNGTWTGGTGGITSSTAATAAAAHKDITALGIELNNNGSGGTLTTLFDGQTVTSTDVLVKYTYYGDADLSGTVTSADYILIDNGFNNHSTGWHNGDFNYDGVVNGDDYTLIDNAYNTQNLGSFAAIGSPAEMIASNTAQVASSSAVPEPTTLSLLAVAAGSLGRRRRRSK